MDLEEEQKLKMKILGKYLKDIMKMEYQSMEEQFFGDKEKYLI